MEKKHYGMPSSNLNGTQLSENIIWPISKVRNWNFLARTPNWKYNFLLKFPQCSFVYYSNCFIHLTLIAIGLLITFLGVTIELFYKYEDATAGCRFGSTAGGLLMEMLYDQQIPSMRLTNAHNHKKNTFIFSFCCMVVMSAQNTPFKYVNTQKVRSLYKPCSHALSSS